MLSTKLSIKEKIIIAFPAAAAFILLALGLSGAFVGTDTTTTKFLTIFFIFLSFGLFFFFAPNPDSCSVDKKSDEQ